MITLRETISPAQVRLDLATADTREAVSQLADLAILAEPVSDPQLFREGILAKADTKRQTEIAPGIWLPHGRVKGVNGVVVSVGRWIEPTAFPWATDPIRLAFLVAGGRGALKDYQGVVGELARRLHEGNRMATLLDAPDPETFVAALVGE